MISQKAVWFLIGVYLFLVTSTTAVAGDEQLYGTWRLVSFTRTVLATGETMDLYGKSPHGFINYGRDGRVLVLIVSDKRPNPADLAKMTDQERVELFKTTIAYGGTYSYDGKAIRHHVDISWNENWTGTEQVRYFSIEDDQLHIEAAPQRYPNLGDKVMRAVLIWERAE